MLLSAGIIRSVSGRPSIQDPQGPNRRQARTLTTRLSNSDPYFMLSIKNKMLKGDRIYGYSIWLVIFSPICRNNLGDCNFGSQCSLAQYEGARSDSHIDGTDKSFPGTDRKDYRTENGTMSIHHKNHQHFVICGESLLVTIAHFLIFMLHSGVLKMS
jgi:hypothetical protein